MFTKKDSIEYILKTSKRKRRKELLDNLDNIVFLDYDGVINTNANNFDGKFNCEEQIKYLNKFCLENNFKIVVCSSWRKYPNYKEILYNVGLDSSIEVIGKTDVYGMGREYEIKEYLKNNYYIDKFIILDDGNYSELSKYHIQPEFSKGFNKEKYEEALEMIKKVEKCIKGLKKS